MASRLLAEVVAVELVGFGVGFSSAFAWLVFALVVFGAGFLRNVEGIQSLLQGISGTAETEKGGETHRPFQSNSVRRSTQAYSPQIFSVKYENLACVEGAIRSP